MELVSVIIPVYNVEKYLDRCMESVVAQTYSDIEIILVDDGAKDSSGRMCDEWAKRDSRVKVIHKENGGLSSARNEGLDVATGKYIYFLDSDDYIKTDLLEKALAWMEPDVQLVSFGYCKSFENGSELICFTQMLHSVICKSSADVLMLVQRQMNRDFPWEAWNRIYRRDIIEQHGLRFEDNKRIFAEDLYFCICYCSHIKKMIHVPEALYYYTIRNDSIMSNNSDVNNIGRFWNLANAVEQYYVKCGYQDLLDGFPIIRALLLRQAIIGYPSFYSFDEKKRKDILLKAIHSDGKAFYKSLMAALKKYQIYRGIDFGSFWRLMNEFRYYFGGNKKVMHILQRAYYKFPFQTMIYSPWNKKWMAEYTDRSNKKKRIYFLSTEEAGNIGDQCINERIHMFLQEYCPECDVKEITINEIPHELTVLLKYIQEDDIIVFAGGGNIGNQYLPVERSRQRVIRTFPKNKKIIFPQSVFFSDDGDKTILESAKECYSKKNNVVLFTRDKYSYEISKEFFDCDVLEAPDIVLYKKHDVSPKERAGILWCMRSDAEAAVKAEDKTKLEAFLHILNEDVERVDLQLPYAVNKGIRKEEVEKRLNLIAASKLIITDRLHGMIFAAITATPCIVFKNYNHKINGAYQWICYLPYVKFVESETEAEREIQVLLKYRGSAYDNERLLPYYKKIASVLRENS